MSIKSLQPPTYFRGSHCPVRGGLQRALLAAAAQVTTLGVLAISCGTLSSTALAAAPDISKLALPPGFEVEVVTSAVPNARQMALSDSGVLYVGSRSAGNVYAVTGAVTRAVTGAVTGSNAAADNGKPSASAASEMPGRVKVHTIARDLVMPSGLAWHDGSLYVGALNKILRFDNIDDRLDLPGDPVLITDQLPDKKHHGWKYLSVGPDNALYVPVGAPCNICKSKDPRFASILRMNPATGATTLYAEGIRNTVGLAWHPDTKALYFTDNGRDMLGEDIPEEEVNRAVKAGSHYGYPYIHAGQISDPEFGKGRRKEEFEPPVLRIQAHSAALGIDFYTGTTFPARYQNALFIAEHGSWNRKEKVGYRVSVMFETDEGPRYEPFITGWLSDEVNWGRPNDVLVTPAGDLLISDDQTGSIYRVSYASLDAS